MTLKNEVDTMKQNGFITGASRGIGAACARRFAKTGYHVFINCKQSVGILHDLRDELRENGGSHDALIGDVGDPGSRSKHCFNDPADCRRTRRPRQ